MPEKRNITNNKEMDPINRLIFYIFSLAVVPASILGIVEYRYDLFFKRSASGPGPLIIAALFAIFLGGVVVAIWRMVNRPKPLKPPAQIIEKVVVQQPTPAKPTPVQQVPKNPVNTPKPTHKV